MANMTRSDMVFYRCRCRFGANRAMWAQAARRFNKLALQAKSADCARLAAACNEHRHLMYWSTQSGDEAASEATYHADNRDRLLSENRYSAMAREIRMGRATNS